MKPQTGMSAVFSKSFALSQHTVPKSPLSERREPTVSAHELLLLNAF